MCSHVLASMLLPGFLMGCPAPQCQAEIKEQLEKVYGLSVEKVNTCNYLGRKKHGKAGFYRCEEGTPRVASGCPRTAGNHMVVL